MYTKTKNGNMQRTFSGMLEDIFQNGLQMATETSDTLKIDAAPVNIQESDKSYDLSVFAPGLKKEVFKIGVDGNILTIAYDHPEQEVNEQVRSLRSEYKIKSFKRSFTLNEKVDTSNIAARYNEGILYITLPKKEVIMIVPQDIKVD